MSFKSIQAIQAEIKENVHKALASILTAIKLTDTEVTMGEVVEMLASVNGNGDHVVFDVSALGAGMYLCTIFTGNGYYRIFDLVTGLEATGFFTDSDLLVDIIKGGSKSSGKHYSVQWDMVNAKGTRLNDAASFETDTSNFGHFGSVNANYSNPFDEIYPWSGRKLCNIDIDLYRNLTSEDSIEDCVVAWEDDANFSFTHQYGVWVYTPQFFGRSYVLGNYRYFDVTDENLGLNNIHYPAMITGRYLGVDVELTIDGASKHCNLPTVGMPMANIAVSTMHTYAKNYGASLTDINTIDASTLLMVVEYATMNSQNAIGQGCTNLYVQGLHVASAVSDSNVLTFASTNANFVKNAIVDIGTSDGGNNVARTYITAVNGASITLADAVTVTTDHFVSIHGQINVADEGVGGKSGYIGTNGKCDAYYRGEILFGNKWRYILGAYRQTGTGEIFVAERDDVDNYDALDLSVHKDTKLALTETSGYVKELGLCDGLSIAPFCTEIGGNSTNPVGDYYYVPALTAGNTILLLGGGASFGSSAGSFFGNWNYTASSSNWGISASPHLKNPS